MGMEHKVINGNDCFVWDDLSENVIDDLALNMMEQNQLDGLLPFRMVYQQENCYFRYDMVNSTVLADWLKTVHSKREVLQLLDSIIMAAEETEQYLLEMDHLYTETAFIVVMQNICHFAYIPIENYEGTEILDFVVNILNQIRYAKDESCTYIFDLMNAITREDVKNIADLKKWMKLIQVNESNSEECIVGNVDASNMQLSNEKENMNEKSDVRNKLPSIPVPKTNERDIPNIFPSQQKLPKEKKSGGFSFGGKKKEKKSQQTFQPIPVEDAATAKSLSNIDRNIQYIDQISDADSTMLVDDYQKNVLIRRSTGEEFPIEAQSYIIGSGGKKHVDILVTGNPAISHAHAQIVRKDNALYIMDLNSTNGTYINGEELKGKEHILMDGMRITLANEEFVFDMRRI